LQAAFEDVTHASVVIPAIASIGDARLRYHIIVRSDAAGHTDPPVTRMILGVEF
jgi:hypothetical protein